MRALEKTPADRFQTMQEFCDCLAEAEAEVDGRPDLRATGGDGVPARADPGVARRAPAGESPAARRS